MEQSNNTDSIGHDWESYSRQMAKDNERLRSEIILLETRADKMEQERYEMRLAMRMILKSFINVEKNRDQLKYYEQAEVIFKKYHDVTDCLRGNSSAEPTIPQQGAVTTYNPLLTENELLKDLLTRIHKRAFEGRPVDLGQGTKQAWMLGEIEDLIERYAPQCMVNEGGEKEGQ